MKKLGGHSIVPVSLAIAMGLFFFGGLQERETKEIVSLLITISSGMAGFGLVAFQIAKASNELRNDFIEISIIMVLSVITGFFYLLYPEKVLLSWNFGEASISLFLWGIVQFCITLVDKRVHILK